VINSTTGEVDSTPFGKIMSYYYLSHKTIRQLLSHAQRNPQFSDVLMWLSLASEFDELPVRHNEDLINAELAKNLPYDGDGFALPMWDPHVKAFLLLQAHFGRIDLPITDYIGDLNSVLDQSIRVCQAAIDILAEKGYLHAVKRMIGLMQSIKTARWPTDGPLAIVPGIDVDRENARVKHGRPGSKDLKWAIGAPRQQLADATVAAGLRHGDVNRLATVLRQLPDLQVVVSDVSTLGFGVGITRRQPLENRGGRMYAPRFPKPQTEGFFVLVSAAGTDELVALKRVGWPASAAAARGRMSVRSAIKLAASTEERKVDVLVMSDGYIGMEWAVKDVVVPGSPSPADRVEK
jgi:antiviral helicase SLH1